MNIKYDMEMEFFESMRQTPIFYFVKKGDTVLSIAQNFHVPVELIRHNNLNWDMLEQGDCLYIPFANTAVHIVKPLETLKNIAAKYNVTEEYIKEKNKTNEIFIGMKLFI